MTIVIDYDAGNLRSVETALRYLGARFEVTADPDRVRHAERVILPGVGDARAAMARLKSGGIAAALIERVAAGVPTLGICLGSQIVLDRSEENEAVCLGIIRGTARRFAERSGRKVPHMGWNTVEFSRAHPLFTGIPDEAYFYFVHSYYPAPVSRENVLAETDYEERFASVIGRDNIVATQFHPEKSGEYVLKMLDNFLTWQGV